MAATINEVMDFVNENDIKFIRLAFCDVFGVQKNISIMPSQLERAFESGISFDASEIKGFGDEASSDLFLYPDLQTLTVLPWRPNHGKVARFFCDIKYPDKTPFLFDCRNLLKNAVATAAKKGFSFDFKAECEFYLFNNDEYGNATKIPFDNGGYMDIAPYDKGENIRREVCLAIEEMGLVPTGSHHEDGPGQNKIDFCGGEALSNADNVTTLKAAVKTLSARSGLYATFRPKPIENKSGNGFHINISPRNFGGIPKEDMEKYIIAGLLKHIPAISAFLNPCDESYKRLGFNKAPKFVSWSRQNRSQLLRIPYLADGEISVELRSPDCMANPYLAYALIIYAVLDGIENKISCPPPVDINLCSASAEETQNLVKLPESFDEAIKLSSESEFVKNILPTEIIEAYKNHIGYNTMWE